MTQVADILRDALGHLKVQDANSAIKAIDARDGIRALNLMMARWKITGLAPTWVDVSDPTETISVLPTLEEAMGYNLALRLRSKYGVALDPDLAQIAGAGVMSAWRDRLMATAVPGTISAGDVIYRALRVLSGKGVGLLPDDFTLSGAIFALNAMMQRLATQGLVLAWLDVDDVSDALGVPDTATDPVVYSLAARLAAEYGVEIPADIGPLVAGSISQLWRDRLMAPNAGASITAGDLIYRSLRVLSGKGVFTMPDGFVLDGALFALNALMARWKAQGLAESWAEVDDTSDPAGIPATAVDPVVNNLAVRLASEYGVDLREEVVALASAGVNDLWRDRVAPESGARTVGSLILRALRLIRFNGALPDTFALPGALAAFNAMLHRWEANGMALAWSPVSSIDDALVTPVEADEAIVFNLAIKLRAEYGGELAPDTNEFARQGLSALRRDRVVEMPLTPDRGRLGGYDIRSDSYL